MRIAGCLLAFILCAGAPAVAGIRATYTVAGEAAPVVVEIDDAGVTRLGTPGGDFDFLVIGSSAYVIGSNPDDPEGRSMAIRADDLVAAIRRAGIRIPADGDTRSIGSLPPPGAGFRDVGAATVAGVAGHRFRWSSASAKSASAAVTMTVADDPALRRGGEAVGIALKTIIIPMTTIMDGDVQKLAGWMQQMLPFLDRGLPLAFDDELVLRELKRDAQFPVGRMTLPSTIVNGAQLDQLIASQSAEK